MSSKSRTYFRNSTLAVFLILIWPILVYAATRNAIADGVWTNTATWFGGNVPTAADDVTTNNNIDLTVENGDNVVAQSFTPGQNGSLTVEAGGILTLDNLGGTGLAVLNAFTLNVDGDLIINGDMVVTNVLTLNVTGNLIINGDIVMSNGATMDVTSSGSITIDGDFTGGNNTSVNVDGTVDVSGSVSVGSGSELTGTGTFTAGDCTGDPDFCNSSTLPVKLLFFKASQVNTMVRLEWATYEQENFDYFCLERSSGGIDYTCIAEIPGEHEYLGILNYSYDDVDPLLGRSYYRLKAVDLDGSYEYFHIITIGLSGGERGFSIYPNPSANGRLTVSTNFEPEEELELLISDLQGRIVYREKFSGFRNEYNVSRSLQEGLYSVTLRSASGIELSRRLVVH